MPGIPVSIRSDDVSVGPPDQVTLTNTELLNALVQFPNQTLQFLSDVNPVKLEEISVDSEGRVLITNSTFAQQVRAIVSGQIGGGDPIGGNVCGNVQCTIHPV